MGTSELFVDWLFGAKNQAKFCEFLPDQRKEEFYHALTRRSLSEISTELYEMSDLFNNNLEQIMAHGRHRDYIQMEAEGEKRAEDEYEMNCSQTL